MTTSTRTAIVVTVAYLVIAYWLLDSFEGGFNWYNVSHTSFSFLPVAILWGWWFYKKRRHDEEH